MAKHIVLETEPVLKQILLLIDTSTGNHNHILNLLIDAFYKEIDTYVLSKKEVSHNASKISPLGIHLLDRIREKISYAVLFLDSEKQKAEVLNAIAKLEPHEAKILILVPARNKSDFLDVYLEVKSKKNISILFVGDIFGVLFQHTKLSKLITSSLSSCTIEVFGNGLTPIFPVSDEDFTNSIKHILLGIKSPTPFYNAYYKDPQTVLSFAHHLKRVEPELSISYEAQVGVSSDSFSQERIIYERVGVRPEYIKPLKGFDKSVESMPYDELAKPVKKQKRMKRIHRQKIVKGVRQFAFKIMVALALYSVVSLGVLVLSFIFLRQGLENFMKGDVKQSVSRLELSNYLYTFSAPSVSAALFMPESPLTSSLREYAQVYSDVQENLDPAVGILKDIDDNKSLSVKQLNILEDLAVSLYFLVQKYNIPELKNVFSSKDFQNNADFLTLFPFITELGGFNGEKSYVLLFQNSNELRPTGGFIGSVGYITLTKGKIRSLTVDDVYDLDGQLKGHVEPHYIIRRYLQPSLYLRDSNFNPDFDVSASSSAFLYNTESKRKIDGIIAVDTYVLKKMVEIAGPIKLDSADKVLSSENIVEILQDSIQEDYFEGSTKKKQLLGELIKKLTVIYETDTGKQIELVKSLPSLMRSKHLLLSFPSKSLQKTLINNGLSGSLKDTRLKSHDIPDYLSVNEANIGVNKANAYVSRKVSYSARLENSTLFSDAALSLENSGKETYKAYVRFIIPEQANITSIIVNDQPQTIVPAVTNPIQFERTAFKAPTGLEVDSVIQDGHKLVGFIVEVPSFTTSNIHVLYSTAYPIKDARVSYSLLFIKQPGTDRYPFLVQLESNDEYRVPKGKNNILMNNLVDGDVEIMSELIKTR